ncbi:GAF and ANTAR domain-containing protein [Nakamurella sp. A5-74]|uniref:GAF and ANTAR domain-containing protein n=1 Tax=Nakamurella sp. A5-74 TaxID=3158264 RepID=A0AAU8DS26_9ACTN
MSSTPEKLTAKLLSRTRDVPVGDIEQLLRTATAAIVEMGVADTVSILERVGDHGFTTRAPTDHLAIAVDRLQRELHEGPCVEASYDNDLLASGDVGADSRWPHWGPAAVAEGVQAVISVQLYNHEQTMGALNLFHTHKRELTTDDLELARTLAVPISIELAHCRQDEHLWKAIDARHRIGQAQGILMERFKISDAVSFSVLRRLSQQGNRKLHLIADDIVRTGQLPPEVEHLIAG